MLRQFVTPGSYIHGIIRDETWFSLFSNNVIPAYASMKGVLF